MGARTSKVDTGIGACFTASAVIHMAVFLLLAWYGSHMPPMKIQETYYVDVVNLPVAAPRAGNPSPKAGNSQPAPAPPKTPAAPMALPVPAKPATAALTAKPPKTSAAGKNPSVESSAEFAERMAKLERQAEARQAEDALKRLREKVKNQGSGRSGMPAASGKEEGSSYEAYIKSRLIDAFRDTISYNSKNPRMVVRIFIDANGKLSRKKTESSSGDPAFEISVLRAIDLASEKFPPPPNHRMFELGVIFNREGVSPNQR
ncbi:MAG: TonB family protein [Desulfobacteraceae bacterium]|nr:TonB family protein [Desulfobacteraceae bacterium]